MKIGFLVAGFNGLHFLENLHLNCNVELVVCYKSRGFANCFCDDIQAVCVNNGYTFFLRSNFDSGNFYSVDLVFVVGWQYIIDNINDNFVVFHDSLLPMMRGFAPTVTALIMGNNQIGVTALKPSEVVDAGDIYEQEIIDIKYPLKIEQAYILLASAYEKVARRIIARFVNGSLSALPQDETKATYSVWRDERDYYIDWRWDAEKISRFVDALGYPFEGARAYYKSKIIRIFEVRNIQEMQFVERHPGKIWALNQGCPDVICAKGMIQILEAKYLDGSTVVFDRLRERLICRYSDREDSDVH